MRSVLTEKQFALADGHPYRRHRKLNVQLVAWALYEHFVRGRSVAQIQQDLETTHGVRVCSRTISNLIRRRTWRNVLPHATRLYSRRAKLTPDEVVRIRYLGGIGLSARMIRDGLQLPVSLACIGRVLRREVWTNVAQPDTDAISELLFGGPLERVSVPKNERRAEGRLKPPDTDSGCSKVAEYEGPKLIVVPTGEDRSAAMLRHRKGRTLVREYDERGRLRAAHWVRGDGFHRVHVTSRHLRPDCGLGLLVSTYRPEPAKEHIEAGPDGPTPVPPTPGSDWQRALPKHPLDQLIDDFVMIALLGQAWDGPFVRPVVSVR